MSVWHFLINTYENFDVLKHNVDMNVCQEILRNSHRHFLLDHLSLMLISIASFHDSYVRYSESTNFLREIVKYLNSGILKLFSSS